MGSNPIGGAMLHRRGEKITVALGVAVIFFIARMRCPGMNCPFAIHTESKRIVSRFPIHP